jgi:hypothetical protein
MQPAIRRNFVEIFGIENFEIGTWVGSLRLDWTRQKGHGQESDSKYL